MARLLLLETAHDDPHRQHRVELFPFLLGLADRLAWEGAWWVLPVPEQAAHEGGYYVHGLPEELLERLCAALGDYRPDLIVSHDRLADGVIRAIGEAAPQATLVDLTRPLAQVRGHQGAAARGATERLGKACLAQPLGADARVGEAYYLLAGTLLEGEGAQAWLTDAVSPRFARRPVPGAPPLRSGGTRVLLVEAACAYRQPARDNPLFAGLDHPSVQRSLGCSFCGLAASSRSSRARQGERPALDPVTRVLRQVQAHQADRFGDEGQNRYLIQQSVISHRLEAFLEAALAMALRPSEFTLMARADDLLRRREALNALLPRLREAGHRLAFVSIGAENFSDEENQRLNKGLTSEQLWDCHALLVDFEARFPGSFAVLDEGYFATILFTPWTRPEDLKANLSAARRLGPVWWNRAVSTRLQLWEGAAITELARRDGLLAESFGAAASLGAVCITQPDDREHPWRFADLRSEWLCAILPRVFDSLPHRVRFDEDDPLFGQIRMLRERLDPAVGDDPVALSEAFIEAVEDGEVVSVEHALEWVARRHPDSQGARLRSEPVGPVLALCMELLPRAADSEGLQTLFLSRVAEGGSFLFREGDWQVWHGSAALGEPGRRFLDVLRRTLRSGRFVPPRVDDVESWQSLARGLARVARLEASHSVRVSHRVESVSVASSGEVGSERSPSTQAP